MKPSLLQVNEAVLLAAMKKGLRRCASFSRHFRGFFQSQRFFSCCNPQFTSSPSLVAWPFLSEVEPEFLAIVWKRRGRGWVMKIRLEFLRLTYIKRSSLVKSEKNLWYIIVKIFINFSTNLNIPVKLQHLIHWTGAVAFAYKNKILNLKYGLLTTSVWLRISPFIVINLKTKQPYGYECYYCKKKSTPYTFWSIHK